MLVIEFHDQAVRNLRAILKDAIPDSKSTHVAEAIAAGFGFQTHATLLSELKSASASDVPPRRTFDMMSFLRRAVDLKIPATLKRLAEVEMCLGLDGKVRRIEEFRHWRYVAQQINGRLAELTDRQIEALRDVPIDTLSFVASSRISPDPSDTSDVWFMTGSIYPSEELDHEVYEGLDETVTVARAMGSLIFPSRMSRDYDMPLIEVYDAPDDIPPDLYEALYDQSGEGLDLAVTTLIGEDYDGIVPIRHCHVRHLWFAKGFGSREDIAVLIDHLVVTFGETCTASGQGILTMGIDAIDGLDLKKKRRALTALMRELGFVLHNNQVFVHQSTLEAGYAGLPERRALQHRMKVMRTWL